MSLPSMKLNYESLPSPLLYICDGKLWGFDCRFQSNQCKCMMFSSVGKRVTAYDVQKLIDHSVNFCWIYIPNCKCPQIAKTNLFFCQKQQGKMIAVKKWIKCDFEVQNKQACTQVLSKLHVHVSGLRFLKCFFLLVVSIPPWKSRLFWDHSTNKKVFGYILDCQMLTSHMFDLSAF